MSYCGCGTSGNKKRWTIILVLAIILVVMNIVWSVHLRSCDICKVGSDDCAEEGNAFSFLFEQREAAEDIGQSRSSVQLELRDCSLGLLRAAFWLAELSLLGIIVILCVFCCCANPPDKTTIIHQHIPVANQPYAPQQPYTPQPYTPQPYTPQKV